MKGAFFFGIAMIGKLRKYLKGRKKRKRSAVKKKKASKKKKKGGKRGRKATSLDTLIKRGSWRAKVKKQELEEAGGAADERPLREIPESVVVDDWPKLLCSLPGYDPYAGAEDYRFDEGGAAKAIDFFQQKLTHVKGELAGQPFMLERWEKAIIANIFGWKNDATGYRRYKEAFIEVARKNGKTPLAAGIILYCLFEDGEPGAEIYGAASEYKQASLVFTHAWGMRNQEQELAERSKIFKGQAKAMEVGTPGDIDYGIYRVISSDSYAAHGFNTHVAVVDELHTQSNRDLVDALETSTAARRQPLIVHITTSDFERDSICNEKEDYALKVRDGIINDLTFLPVVYQASIEDDWKDPEVWKKANPNLGVSVSLEYLEAACKRAQETPSYENTFKRLHLNIRTQADVLWIPLDKWDDCDERLKEADLAGKECYEGIDLSSNTDIAARVLVFPLEEDKYAILTRFYIPEDNAKKRSETDRVPYLEWAKQGYITLTPGNVVDYAYLKKDLAEDYKKFKHAEIAFDRWNFEAFRQQLISEGIDAEKFVAFGQGFASMSAPTKELEKLILAKKLIHNNNPVLRWMASNLSVELDPAGNIKPSKKKSTERIDGMVGLIMGLGRAITTEPPKISVYESRGALNL